MLVKAACCLLGEVSRSTRRARVCVLGFFTIIIIIALPIPAIHVALCTAATSVISTVLHPPGPSGQSDEAPPLARSAAPPAARGEHSAGRLAGTFASNCNTLPSPTLLGQRRRAAPTVLARRPAPGSPRGAQQCCQLPSAVCSGIVRLSAHGSSELDCFTASAQASSQTGAGGGGRRKEERSMSTGVEEERPSEVSQIRRNGQGKM